jgi:signal peptidase I
LKNLHQDSNPLTLSGFTGRLTPEITGLFEDILNRGLSLRVKVTGRSMAPFLKGGELLTINQTDLSSLRRGDLLFFRDAYGHPVLHRIISKQPGCDGQIIFKTKGDGLRAFDEPVSTPEVLGKACKIENMDTVIGIRQIDMEAPLWKGINYFLALVNLAELKMYFVRSRLAISLKLLTRKIMALFMNL